MTTWQFTPYVWLYGLALVISLYVTARAWKMRLERGGTLFILLTFSTCIWILGYLLGFFNTDPQWKLVMLRVEYLGIIGANTIWLLFVAAYTHYDTLFEKQKLILLSICPAATYLLVLTFQHHNYFYRSYEFIADQGLILSSKVYGPWFYLWIGYSYLLMFGGVALLLRGMLHMPEKFRWQIIPLVFVVVVILFPSFLYISSNNPFAPYDPTPLSFAIAGLLLIVAMHRYRFLDIVPVAHNLVFKHVKSGVIIINSRALILEMNPASEQILNFSQADVLGQPIDTLFPQHPKIIRQFQNLRDIKSEIQLGEDQHFEIQTMPIANRVGQPEGRIIMLYDISERKRTEDELRRQATTDSLTSVFNRRHFFSLAEPIFQHAKRYQRGLAALMIDLDHFKRINDQHGHMIGDQVLIALANLMQGHIRSPDILARYGGEEFVVLIQETSLEGATQVAERLRQSVDGNTIETKIGPVPLTISVGLATLDRDKDFTIDKLIDKADQALYKAKQAGRNRVCIFEADHNL